MTQEPSTMMHRHPINEDSIREDMERMLAESADWEQRKNAPLFTARRASEWLTLAAGTPMPDMLFDSMWYEGELCILFADTNVGKSILAVQIGDSISRGEPIPGFRMTAQQQQVAYFDFELSSKQFQARYTFDAEHHYPFADSFIRLKLDMSVDHQSMGYETFEEYLYYQLEQYIITTGIRVLIIDNLTYLHAETEQAKDASTLMKILNTIKEKHQVSMLVLAHTPKRDHSKPIEQNHLEGSKKIANLCDAIITIGQSHKDGGLRYIKQLKGRMKEKEYEADHVCICQVTKPYDFLHFELMGYGREREHLKEMGNKEYGSKVAAVKDLSAQGLSQREIAKQMNISLGSVHRYLSMDEETVQ